MNKTHTAVTQGGSAFQRYCDLIVGSRSLTDLLYFEWCLWLSNMVGAGGILLRNLFWPKLFKSCGKKVNFSSYMVLRQPGKIAIGDRVIFSENCILDARNTAADQAITIGNDVILSNGVSLSCKNGSIRIGNGTGININTIIQSTNECPVHIGSEVVIGPNCFIGGGGNYRTDRLDISICKQGMIKDDGIQIDDDVWIGAGVNIIGEVKIEPHSIIAAGAVVNKSIPEKSIYGGIPARLLKKRGSN